jgi:uncharacterized protein YegP (UPF0339 family)
VPDDQHTKSLAQYHVKVFKDSKGEWRWTTIASNGEPVANSSEGYVNKGHALEQAKALNPGIDVKVEDG